MAERFYINSPLQPGPVLLQGAEAHHLARVSRIRPGDRVCLFNGAGHEYPAEVLTVGRSAVELQVLSDESPQREVGFLLHVAAPLPKGDRGQFLIEKLTELGATRFTPLLTERSIVHPGESKLDKLHRWVIEASKQCGRNVLMTIEPATQWTEFCRREGLPARRWLADRQGRPVHAGNAPDTVVAVGPEGGFTTAEVESARQAGWELVSLGPRVLRIETAALLLAGLCVTAAHGTSVVEGQQ